MTSLNE